MVNLLQGDCLELLREIPDNSVDCIVTDPPYKIVSGGCTNKGNMATTGCLKQNSEAVRHGKMFKHNDIAFVEWLPDVFRVLKHDSHCYIMINGRNISDLQRECEKAGFKYQNLLIWNKGNVTPNKWYMNQCEFILMLRKGKAKNIRNMGTTTLLTVPNIIGKKLHPTEKPPSLLEILINNSTEEGQTVLDPFMGSGATGVACVRAGRNFIGMELDQNYFQIAQKRIYNITKGDNQHDQNTVEEDRK